MSETFVTIAKFTYSSEAQIVKGRLEDDGIPVFLSDNFTIDTDPLVSNAIGGVKVKVYKEDEQRALETLKEISKYSTDDHGNAIHCPNCDSTRIEYFSNVKDVKSLIHFLFGFFISGLPWYVRHQYQCEECSLKFNLEKEEN